VVETDDRPVQARPQSRQDRHEGAGHLGAVLRRRARAGENLLGGKKGMGFVQLMQELPQERLIIAVGGVAADGAALEDRRWPTPRSARPSASPSSTSRTPASSWPNARPGAGLARLRRRGIGVHLKGELDVRRAAMAKYWTPTCSAS
jgi:hypothetical protein